MVQASCVRRPGSRVVPPTGQRRIQVGGRARWVDAALAAGTLTLADLRNASSTTRALAGAGNTPAETPLPVPQPPGPVSEALSAAAERPREAEELLDDFLIALFELPGWSRPADAVLWSDVALRCRTSCSIAFTPTSACKRSPGKSRAAAAGPVFPVP